MGSSNPVSTTLDSTQTVVQRFYLQKQNLVVDSLTAGGVTTATQINYPSTKGSIATPGSLSSVKRQGVTLVYGVYVITVKQDDKDIQQNIISQISPTVSAITRSGKPIVLSDNVSLAATSDNKDSGWIYVTQKEGSEFKIVEYALTYTNNADPMKSTGTMSNVHLKTRLGAATIPAVGLLAPRLLAYQTSDKNIRLRRWPGTQDDTVETNDVMEQTPLAVAVVQGADNKPKVLVYFITQSNKRLMRAERALEGGSFASKPVYDSDPISDSSDLAATSVPGGVLVSFILKDNTTYAQILDSV